MYINICISIHSTLTGQSGSATNQRLEHVDGLVLLYCDTSTHFISRVKSVAEVPTCSIIALFVSHYICLASDSTSGFELSCEMQPLSHCSCFPTACEKLQSVIVLHMDIQRFYALLGVLKPFCLATLVTLVFHNTMWFTSLAPETEIS